MRRLLPAVLLAACAAKEAPPPDLSRGSCDAAKAQFAVGKKATPELVEQARKAAGASRIRQLKPGQMISMEYMGSRLNLEVDSAGVVLKARCG